MWAFRACSSSCSADAEEEGDAGMSFFNTVEFYVIAATVGAAVVALAALPQHKGEARLHLLSGELAEGSDPDEKPGLKVWVDDSRRVHILRTGLTNVRAWGGACSLAVNVRGFDIDIEERHFDGSGDEMHQAHFVLDFLAPERYHVKYSSADHGLFAAFSLPVREGIKIERELLQ